MKIFCLIFAIGVLVVPVGERACADNLDLNAASLSCFLSRSEVIYIFKNEGAVIFHFYLGEPEELVLEHGFQTLSCSQCYKFAGSALDRRYEGRTFEMIDSETAELTVYLNLKVDDESAHNYPCFKHEG